MASLPTVLLLLLLSVLFLTRTSSTPNLHHSSVFPTDVHDLLPSYGLPKGLLPNNVKSYTLTNDGVFTIELESHCYVHFDRLVYYDKKISGKLSYGAVRDVKGIQAKKLFLWVSVTAIEKRESSDMIDFFVGFVSESLPAKQFEKIPACGSRVGSAMRSVDSI